MSKYLETFELISYVVTILGFPMAIYIYWREQKEQREARLYGAYDALDDKYIELQSLCLEHPRLDIFDTAFDTVPELTEAEKKQEEAILLIRISIFERAYLMYRNTPKGAGTSQWSGWESEILDWLKRKNFKVIWIAHKVGFDSEFINFCEEKLNE